jgi:hypothetical protein
VFIDLSSQQHSPGPRHNQQKYTDRRLTLSSYLRQI